MLVFFCSPRRQNKWCATAEPLWSSTRLSLRCLAFTWVIWPLEKSNTSSLSSLRMIMLFWQRLSLVRLAPTMSLMKVGQCLGHSCFRIWAQSRIMSPPSSHPQAKKQKAFFPYLYEDHVEFGNINALLLWRQVRTAMSAWCQHLYILPRSLQCDITSMFAGSDEVLMINPTTYFLIPTEDK